MGSLQGASSGDVGGLSAKPIFFNRRRQYAVPVLALAAVSTLAGFEVARFQGSARWSNGNLVEAASLIAEPSRSKIAANASLAEDPSVNTFSRLAPQEQAERSLERAIARDTESLDIIGKNVDGWRG